MNIDRSSCTAKRHGSMVAYTKLGCRCPDARETTRLYRKRRREQRLPDALIPSIGTMRRLQALAALGWSCEHLAPLVGSTRDSLPQVRRGARVQVRRSFARQVNVVYDRLSTTPGPNRLVRLRALHWGWAVPALWDDEAIDDPNARPVTDIRAGRPDRLAEVAHLTSCGEALEQAIRQVGLTPASYERAMQRSRHREAS